jgi:Ca-activated chloride channel family protein
LKHIALGCSLLLFGCAEVGPSQTAASSPSPGKVAYIGSLRGGAAIATSGGPRRATVRTEPPSLVGELEPGVVAREVRARLGAIKACYERSLQRDPALSGRLVLRWTITSEGKVQSVDVASDTLAAPVVSDCVRSLVLRWRFPVPSRGSVEVVVPFLFAATAG